MTLTLSAAETELQEEVMDLSTYFASTDYTQACTEAERETGYTFPVTGKYKKYWIKQPQILYSSNYLFSVQLKLQTLYSKPSKDC